MAGPKLSGCLPVRSSWTQVIRLFTSQTWRTQVIRLFTSHKWLWTQNIRLFTSQKWLDPSYQAAYQLEVAGPKLSGFSQSKVAGPKLSGCLPVRSSWTQVIRLFTSHGGPKLSDSSPVTSGSGPKISGFSPVKSGWTQVIRLLTS